MKLLKLKLRNFKGIKSLELVANGQDLRIYGDNATGKTTVYDAFLWLLFDKDSQNRADFAIKTLDKDGEPIHHLDHEVEGVFEINGERIELRKVYREKWTKRRGSATEEFTGHETDHYIDGVPVKKSEYTQRVAEIAPEDRFKLLTSPLFFNEHMKWQDRRALLIEIAGDVTMEDVIAANPDLKELPTILGKHSPNDYKAIVMARRAEVNKELGKIPIRIDEVSQGMPDIGDITDPEALDANIAKLEKARMEKEAELATLMSSGNQGKIRQQIAEVDAQMMEVENDHKREIHRDISKLDNELRDTDLAIGQAKRRLAVITVDISDYKKRVEQIDMELAQLRDKWHEVNRQELELCVDESCPTCGQALPAEKVEEAREKAIADFNSAKAEKLEAINNKGKDMVAEQEALKGKIADWEAEKLGLADELKKLEKEKSRLEKDLQTLRVVLAEYQERDDYKKLAEEKAQLLKALDGDQEALVPEKQKLEGHIKALDEDIDALKAAKAKFELYQQANRRIAELQAQESELAKEFEKLERELYLIEEYIKTKAELLTDKINSRFELAQFALFETQINGGINPICETTYKGVPWGSLNSAGKVQVGLDIIKTLQDHYGLRCPVWIDNRESVVELPEMDCQVISLIVSEKDKTLRVEGPDKESVKQSLFEEAI